MTGVPADDDEPPLSGEPSSPGSRRVATPLSPRELECLSRIAAGESSVEIAAALGISPRTVDHYIGFAKAKLLARNRVQAVATAIRLGWIPRLPPK